MSQFSPLFCSSLQRLFRFIGAAFVICALTASLAHSAEYYNDWVTTRLAAYPSTQGPAADADSDGVANLIEFALGTDPTVSDNPLINVQPQPIATDGTVTVQLLERAGHRPGVQYDLDISTDGTIWHPIWWLRTTTALLASDPVGATREVLNTRLPAGTASFSVRCKFKVFEAGPEQANYYVATNGSDSNAGTLTAPFASLTKAVSVAVGGNLVYVRGGTYTGTASIYFNKVGSASSLIRIRAYPGELPVFDYSAVTGTSLNAITFNGSYYHVYGLKVVGAPHNNFLFSGSNNIAERCISESARNTGFQITGGSSGSNFPANNLLLNCDSLRSYDAPIGGNADGFGAKWNLGTGNVWRGCRAIESSDDGWDLWMGSSGTLIENCWAARSGIDVWGTSGGLFDGNGQGFKLGGNGTPAPHRIVGCVAWGNRAYGIDQNNNSAGQTADNNTVWSNGSGGVNLNHLGSSYPALTGTHTIRNNASIGASSIASSSTQQTNTWQILSSVAASDFLSTDVTLTTGPRRDDGGLPDLPFLRPVPGGRLIGKGTDLGAATSTPFSSSVPDLGAYDSLNNQSFVSPDPAVVTVTSAAITNSIPTITTQPNSQTVLVGQPASFTAAANGLPTPTYQWQKSTDSVTYTAISGATAASFSIGTTTASDAAFYRVVATNTAGSATSTAATLTVNLVGSIAIDSSALGTTGGAAGTTVSVSTAANLRTYAETANTAYTIIVSGTIDLGASGRINVASNKTIKGYDTNATILGTLALTGVSNVILSNLNLSATPEPPEPTTASRSQGRPMCSSPNARSTTAPATPSTSSTAPT